MVVSNSESGTSLRNVVILPIGASSRGAAIQPLPTRPRLLDGRIWGDVRPRTWRSFLGSEPRFPSFYRFAEATLPSGDLQIVVATDAGNGRYSVKAQERDLIR
jgi:hypothetical protein